MDEVNELFINELDNLEFNDTHASTDYLGYLLYLYSSNTKVKNICNSAIAYVIGVTSEKPIREADYEAGSAPDIDLDYQDDRRDEVIEYARQKYKHVAGISTFGTMKCRGAIKAAARTLGADYTIGDVLSKLTPTPINGVAPKLTKCYEQVEILNNYHNNSNSTEGKVLRLADQIEDRIDKAGVHASGWVIGDRPLHEIIPLTVRKEILASEWDMNEIEKIGLIKFDFLGLTALTAISKTLVLIKERHGKTIDLCAIPDYDEEVFRSLQAGDNIGIFQVETSGGMRDLMVKMRPKSISDLGLLTAIYRPGPLSADYLQVWLKARSGEGKAEYISPALEPILKATDGFLVYQEQCMKMAVDLAGYTAAEADSLRKAIGKKLPEEMAKHEGKFLPGLIKSGLTEKQAHKLWDDLKGFAAYSFNKAHAIAYGYLAYQTAWLKTHYTEEYMCALLTCNQNDVDQVIKYIFDCREHNIKVLPPDINISSSNFTIDESGNIRFGLAAIKNLGEDTVLSIIKARGNIKFKDLADFISRVDVTKVNKRKLESLVLTGAFDFSGHTRASMVNVIEQSIDYRKDIKSYESKLQTYNKKIEAWKVRNEQIKNAEVSGQKTKLKPLQDPKRPEELKKPSISSLPEIAERELLAYEKELLGFFVSGHPVEKYSSLIASDPSLSTVEKIKTIGHNGAIVNVIAIPTSLNERTTKSSGKKMASMILEDLTANINATAFPQTWLEIEHLIKSNEPLLLKCKTAVQDAGDTGTITELFIQTVSALKYIGNNKSTIEIQVKAEPEKIQKLHDLINKYSGDETKVKINIICQDGTKISLPRTFTIRSQNAFLLEMQKELI